MLTPDYLASCTDYLLKLYGDLEDEIIRDIARRIVKTGVVTATAEWQVNQLEELGALQDQIIERVAQSAGKREREIRKLFQESAIRNIETNAEPLISHGINVSLALSPAMRDVLKAAIERTEGNIRNLTLTTGSTSGELYLQCSNEAYMKAVSGAFSPQEAIYQAVKKAGAEGATVQFATRKDKLDVAIRRNVMTSVNQTAGRITVMHAADLGAEFYETSAHPGARPTHAEWQGQVFQISGSSRGYPNFYDATGYGEVDGLCGVNCRHSFYPFFPEYSERAYSDEKLQEYADQSVEYNGARYSYYESSQIQRKLERSIRESKRILTGIDAARDAAEDDATRERLSDGFEAESVKLKEKEAKLKDFLKQTGRGAESDRVRVPGFNKAISQKAVWAAKKNAEDDETAFSPKKIDYVMAYTFASGDTKLTNALMSGKAEQISSAVDTILNGSKYGLPESHWSHVVNVGRVEDMSGIKGRKDYNCDITIREDYVTNIKTYIHENLHARSVSRYKDEGERKRVYLNHKKVEEGSVEYLAQEICKRSNIPFDKSYASLVKLLHDLKIITKPSQDEYDFAKSLLEVPLDARYNYIKELVDGYKNTSKNIRMSVSARLDKILQGLGSEAEK